MSINVYFDKVSKKLNSTKRPTVSHEYEVVLKDGCAEDAPVFLLKRTGEGFPYNYAKWGDNYYFITDVEYTRNNLYTVSCELDVLATYKTEILDTTAFVSYSSVSGGAWLPDTRLPVMRNCVVANSSAELGIFSQYGFYVLSAIGRDGCLNYGTSLDQLKGLLTGLDTWREEMFNEFTSSRTYDTAEKAIESFAKMSIKTDILGNAYENVPACIRSCIWVPFLFPETSETQEIRLGRYNTKKRAYIINALPYTGTVNVTIPWQYADWRRGFCEDVYLYLPLVGMIALASDSITNVSTLKIDFSYTLTDGTISYQVYAGAEILGTYGGSCAVNYPIGLNQQASAGEVLNSIIAGAEKSISVGASAGMNSIAGAAATTAEAALSVYNVIDTAYSTHPTCIGGVGGGSGAGLLKEVYCYTVKHSTVIEPSAMQATMGVPTMKPLKLSNCTGYCQCANAHVSAPAHIDQLAQIDAFLNGGFFIE